MDKRPPSASASARLKPRVRLSCGEFGELYLYLDDIIDPEALATTLTDARGHVYWRQSTQQLAYANSVGYGVLVLEDQRYVSGWLESADSSVALPKSARVPSDAELPTVGELRAVHPASPIEANANATILIALVISLAALAVITVGVGDAATVALATLSAAVVVMGRRRARSQVRAHLEGLAPAAGRSSAT